MARRLQHENERRSPGKPALVISLVAHVALAIWLLFQVVELGGGEPRPKQAKIGPELLPAVDAGPPAIDPPSEEPEDEKEPELEEAESPRVEIDEPIPAPWRTPRTSHEPHPELPERPSVLANRLRPIERETSKEPMETSSTTSSAPEVVEAPPAPDPLISAKKSRGSCPTPPYPRRALRRRLEGRVILLVDIGADGRVLDLEVQTSSGHGILDRAAAKAVRGWRFVPASRGGIPQRDRLRVPINFRLP